MLSGIIRSWFKGSRFLRPPGAVPEAELLQKCLRCRRCAEVCPYECIQMAHGEQGITMGTPQIFAAKIPCYLCDDFPCIGACPSAALEAVDDRDDVKMGTAVIDTSLCFPYNGILCRACYERCPVYRQAIILRDELYPEVQKDYCVGCGICEHVCPTETKAIIVHRSGA